MHSNKLNCYVHKNIYMASDWLLNTFYAKIFLGVQFQARNG